jgi:beta-lactam-binding protein with PASTA domain
MNQSLPDPFKSPRKTKETKGGGGMYKFTIFLLIAVIVGGGAYFMFIKPQGEGVLGEQTQNDAETEKYNQIIQNLKKKILLPEENPTVATIVDIEEVKKQNPKFYESASEGDIVFIFTTKALIYRESQDLIVNVAPVAQAE